MTETNKKLTRPQACVTLALRLGWQPFPSLIPSALHPEGRTVYCPPGEQLHISTAQDAPNYFEDKNEAHKLVEWLATQHTACVSFLFHLRKRKQLSKSISRI